MPHDLQRRIERLAAQAQAKAGQDEHEWWRRPGAVEEARRSGERKLAAILLTAYETANTPEQLRASLAAVYPGYPDAYSEDERTEIILRELFHNNPELKASIHRDLKARLRGV